MQQIDITYRPTDRDETQLNQGKSYTPSMASRPKEESIRPTLYDIHKGDQVMKLQPKPRTKYRKTFVDYGREIN
ncbi:hypothetical protein KIN20_011565 [Parelaphostrongylus tenuis]|uniref:Uncharacterized protein n=1 Tax=Parelaphostrongylus tenuis TaxID=148309 RepID=A0AAD5QPY7_PARTN|nr:hypothetical protein KIN20_011565 [Parelaphostrongylus tenuis]